MSTSYCYGYVLDCSAVGWCRGTISDIDGNDIVVNYVEDGKVGHKLLDFDVAKYGTVWVHLARPRHVDRQASPVDTSQPMELAEPPRQLNKTPKPTTATETAVWKMKMQELLVEVLGEETVQPVGGIKSGSESESESESEDAVVPGNSHALDQRSVSIASNDSALFKVNTFPVWLDAHHESSDPRCSALSVQALLLTTRFDRPAPLDSIFPYQEATNHH